VLRTAFLELRFDVEIFWHKNIGAKGTCKMLMKLTPVVNFTNILKAYIFLHIFFCQKFTNTTVTTEKLCKTFLLKKAAHVGEIDTWCDHPMVKTMLV